MKSSKQYRENRRVNQELKLGKPVSRLQPLDKKALRKDTGTYFRELPNKCEIRKQDRDINIQEE